MHREKIHKEKQLEKGERKIKKAMVPQDKGDGYDR